ncbi:MAG TPA: DUF983 domain-containing protein [Blastocatellia bacterium]|nr:DUF983 domain-containing protein [Blastocatellia bacterium]
MAISKGEKIRHAAFRALALRCPDCGKGTIFESGFKTRKSCPNCGLVYEREQGYFVGAIYFNVIVTESLIIAAFIVSIIVLRQFNQKIETVLFVLAILMPILFFRHSRSFWLAFDHLISPSEKDRPPRNLPFTQPYKNIQN